MRLILTDVQAPVLPGAGIIGALYTGASPPDVAAPLEDQPGIAAPLPDPFTEIPLLEVPDGATWVAGCLALVGGYRPGSYRASLTGAMDCEAILERVLDSDVLMLPPGAAIAEALAFEVVARRALEDEEATPMLIGAPVPRADRAADFTPEASSAGCRVRLRWSVDGE